MSGTQCWKGFRNDFEDYVGSVDTDLDILRDFLVTNEPINLNLDQDSLENLFSLTDAQLQEEQAAAQPEKSVYNSQQQVL